MRDELALLRDARPEAKGPSRELARAARGELMSEIAVQTKRRWSVQRRAVVLLAAAVTAGAAALVGVTLSGQSGGTAWAAPLVRVAQAAPRLLVGASGWEVTRADEFGVGYGEMTFSNGDRRLDLQWDRGRDLGAKLARPGSGIEALGTITERGLTMHLFRYVGVPDYVATWSQGGYGLHARGLAAGVDQFKALVSTLHEVDVEAWLSAMPQSVVKPAGRSKIVLAMLDGVPLPPHFDVGALLRRDSVTVVDRYQLGAHVSSAVACVWLQRWVIARREGDAPGVRQAVAALRTSHRWGVLQEMQAEGDYPKVLWQYADAAAADAPIQGGKALSVEESYRSALGC
jgi:hypothetical protein